MKKKEKKNKTEIVKAQSLPTSDPLQLYLQEIKKFPVLSKEEEKKLTKFFYETRDPKTAQMLAQANLRFVVKIAAEYTRFGAKLLELVQEGNMGLLHAIKEFNPFKGVRLITYAVWWIRGYIQEYLMRQHSLVRIGTNSKQRKLYYLLKKQQNQLAQLSYNQNKKLLSHSGFKEKEVESMQQRLQSKDISLDQPISRTGSEPIIDIQACKESSVEEKFNFLQEKKLLKNSINKLKPQLKEKEIFILEKRLLADPAMTLQEIGNHFSVTRESIRQVESRLIQKLKNQMMNEKA